MPESISETNTVFKGVSNKESFADFKCSGSSYKDPPDVLALSEDSGVANIKIVGELKVPWVEGHSLDAADENDHPRIAVKLA
ncbi:hypothetical protein N7541_003963 [Penicillium brevicompactum]|uniref:Uncharacterized protein n=1 Tax=Penicillium brevicompactum TaxID=5074 RepID=A0A9W9RPV7_PENBR|nr:hypothetical protein N7541_003963 [Penicillium brevicompactum]